MKKLLLLTLFVLALYFPLPVAAQSQNELLPKGQIIDSDYIRAANQIQIDGDIKGDAFLIGGLVTVNGQVEGDLFVLGGKVNINGPVGNSVRVVGGDVVLNSSVGRNVLMVCGNCSVNQQATISGSLLVSGGNLELAAERIGRGFRFFGSRLFLNSEIANEAYVVADREFLLGPKASISGTLKYAGQHEVTKEAGATVAGTIAYEKTNKEETFPRFFGARGALEGLRRLQPLTDFFGFLVSALVGFVLLGLFAKGFEKVTMAVENQPYASLGWGVIVALMVPVFAVLFALTIVGIPISLLLLVMAYILTVAAKYLIAFFIGRKILISRFGERRGWALVLGLFLIYLLGLVPVVGALIKLILILFALGGMILAYRHPTIIKPQSEALLKRGPRRSSRRSKV